MPINSGSSLTASARASGSAELPGDVGGFVIEVVEHLDVIAQKSDRTEHRRLQSAGVLGAQVVADVRLEPRVGRPPAAALVDERPVGDAEPLGDQTRALHQLRPIALGAGHRGGNAVRGENDPRLIPHRLGQRVTAARMWRALASMKPSWVCQSPT